MSTQETLSSHSQNALTNMRCAVIGAGIAGATAVRHLKDLGIAHVSLFDKGREFGGRISTKVLEGFAFEFGASVIADEPYGWISEFIARFPKQRLSHHRQNFSVKQPQLDMVKGSTFQRGIKQIVDVQAKMADELYPSTRILRIEKECAEWWLYGHQYQTSLEGKSEKHELSWGPFDTVLLAIPSPQAAQILFPHRADWARLALQVRYESIISLSVYFDQPIRGLPRSVAQEHPIGLIRQAMPLDDQHTPSTFGRAWVIQANPNWSADHLDQEVTELCEELLRHFGDLLDEVIPTYQTYQVHRWRYATPLIKAEEAVGVLFDHTKKLYVIGDWTSGPNGGWAYQSGQNVANLLYAEVTKSNDKEERS